ncbi:MAG TPA: hypothetical protein VGN31_12095 [Paraburkholderia sp.]
MKPFETLRAAPAINVARLVTHRARGNPRKLAYVDIVLHSNRFAPKIARGFATMARYASLRAASLHLFCVVASRALADRLKPPEATLSRLQNA